MARSGVKYDERTAHEPGPVRANSRVLLCVGALVGCSVPGTLRTGSPYELRVGQPLNRCEAEQWIDLVPSRTTVVASPGNAMIGAAATLEGTSGHAFYPRVDDADSLPLDVETTLEQVGASAMLTAHRNRTESFQRRLRVARGVMLTGGAVAMLGLGLAIATGFTELPSDPWLGVGIGMSATGFLTFLITALTGSDRGAAYSRFMFRARMLLPEEDSLNAARSALERYHWQVRMNCERLLRPATPTAASLAPMAAVAPGTLAPSTAPPGPR